MGLESGTYISDLVASNPLGTDPKSQGANHLRLIKATIKNSFPEVAGAVAASHLELSFVQGVTSAIQDQINARVTAHDALVGAVGDLDAQNVKLGGAQEVTGAKNFSGGIQAASVELGHASDTTLSRIAAGRAAIEGGEVAKLNANQPFTAVQEFRVPGTTVNSSRPFVMEQPGAGVDLKRWAFRINASGTIVLSAYDDADVFKSSGLHVQRDADGNLIVVLYAGINRAQLETQPENAEPATTGVRVKHSDGAFYDGGLNVMPPLTLDASFTLARTHAGKALIHTGTGAARTWTTPASTDTGVPVGTLINGVNVGSSNVTIAAGSGVTLSRLNGLGAPATGSRIASPGAVWSMYRQTANLWRIWGNAGLN